jgi:hypothetical protein
VTASTQVIIDWLTSIGWDTRQEAGYPLLPGPEILSEPDKIVHITGTGGPGYLTEEPATDGWGFQARVRGPADDPIAAEDAARQLDTLILGASFPAMVDGVQIQHVHRLSSRPAPLPLDPNDRRFEYTCSYLMIAGV